MNALLYIFINILLYDFCMLFLNVVFTWANIKEGTEDLLLSVYAIVTYFLRTAEKYSSDTL